MAKAVGYFRVSTAGQGRSGLGLEAQRKAVEDVASARGLTILAQFTEVESGKRNDRPQLQAALHHARLTGAVLVIAKLDRLSRNASFLLALRDSGVRFVTADIPDANDITIGVLAVIAQAEREAISRRTRDALAVVRARLSAGEPHVARSGRTIQRLGNPDGAATLTRRRGDGATAARAIAVRRAEDLMPPFATLASQGLRTASGIAKELNRQGLLTPRRKRWHPSTVRNIQRRIAVQGT